MSSVNNKKVSIVWEHFEDLGGHFANCKICKAKLSYRTSVTNLKKHIDRKHPNLHDINRKGNIVQSATEPTTSLQTTQLVLLLPQPVQVSPTLSTQPPASSPPANSHQPITNFVPRQGNQKFDIDKRIMNLFIKDFQPFRIIEDKGFRELLTYAFPNYIIPTRKHFSNNLLPATYGEAKYNLQEVIFKEAKTLCITLDIWTNCVNDSMLFVTCHYIEEIEFKLKSYLLDCMPLSQPHTAKNLADYIKEVCDQWRVTDRVSLAVSDNGANIKSAIENEIRWKHFPCYNHTLNSAVSDILENPELSDMLNKIKGIVRHFKQSNIAWEKLKSFQEQAGSTPKRLLQDVLTHWNSTFYMLKRCAELKEPLNSAMENLGMEAITGYEWIVIEELIQVLHLCEEVTREISTQNYITGSLVIPITTELVKALENLSVTYNFMPVMDQVLQDLISGIKTRFANINRSETFSDCLFLDPRFKFYFDDAIVADETKGRIIGIVAAEDARGTRSENNSQVQPLPPYTHTEDTSHSSAIVEVQRYYADKMIARTDCPMQWWRDHKNMYPTLYKIAAKKLNVMASSVPCKRFSMEGNTPYERRTRLSAKKLQQLIFLQQNT